MIHPVRALHGLLCCFSLLFLGFQESEVQLERASGFVPKDRVFGSSPPYLGIETCGKYLKEVCEPPAEYSAQSFFYPVRSHRKRKHPFADSIIDGVGDDRPHGCDSRFPASLRRHFGIVYQYRFYLWCP
jgi:hypothetical protein